MMDSFMKRGVQLLMHLHFPMTPYPSMDGVGEEGTFVCPEVLPVEEGKNGVPEGWKIKN